MKAGQVPERFSEVTLADVLDGTMSDEVLDSAEEWVEQTADGAPPPWGLLLIGAPGVGKSWVIAGMMNAMPSSIEYQWVSAQNLVAMYYRKIELSEIIKKLTALDDDTPELIEKRNMDRLIWRMRNEFPVLVVDDLGRERETVSGFVSGTLDELIRTRADNGLCTHVTSNLSSDQIQGRYGEPLRSLLREITRGFAINTEDYRRNVAP